MNLMEVKGVTKRFKEKIVLYNVSLQIPERKIFGIIGKSGCGKTTLLNIIVGYMGANSGKVVCKGKRTFGFSSQACSFYGKLTVEENLRYFGRLQGMKSSTIRIRINDLVRMLGLADELNTLGNELSRGMQKRLDIACALIHNPLVLILDEPTADLDPILRRDILKIVKKINEAGTTIIITSHILGEIDYLCDEVAILDQGRVICVDKPAKLEKFVGDGKTVSVEIASHNYKALYKHVKQYVSKCSSEANRFIMHTDDPFRLVVALLRFVKDNDDHLVNLKVGRASLNSLFEEIIRNGHK